MPSDQINETTLMMDQLNIAESPAYITEMTGIVRNEATSIEHARYMASDVRRNLI